MVIDLVKLGIKGKIWEIGDCHCVTGSMVFVNSCMFSWFGINVVSVRAVCYLDIYRVYLSMICSTL